MKILFIMLLLISSNLYSKEGETRIGIDGGYGFYDNGAQATAQTIANTSGSTVTYTSDYGTWVGRIYADYSINDNLLAEIGYFISGEVNATYTLSGASAEEAYSANGLDFAGVYKDDSGLFFKGGIHQSTVEGNASVTIGGNTYAANAAASGNGFLFGGGYEADDGSRWGYTYYSSVGGLLDADVGFIYYGIRF